MASVSPPTCSAAPSSGSASSKRRNGRSDAGAVLVAAFVPVEGAECAVLEVEVLQNFCALSCGRCGGTVEAGTEDEVVAEVALRLGDGEVAQVGIVDGEAGAGNEDSVGLFNGSVNECIVDDSEDASAVDDPSSRVDM
jgi:hypothetical protein